MSKDYLNILVWRCQRCNQKP